MDRMPLNVAAAAMRCCSELAIETLAIETLAIETLAIERPPHELSALALAKGPWRATLLREQQPQQQPTSHCRRLLLTPNGSRSRRF